MTKEDEKFEIEDIKSPESEGDLDIEEVVSEKEEKAMMPDEDVDTAETADSHADTAEVLDEEKVSKSTGSKHPESDAQPSTFEKGAADKDVLEKAVEEEKEKKPDLIETPLGKKPAKRWWKTAIVIFVTILATAALVLGGVYMYMARQKKEEPKKEESKQEETKAEEPATTTTEKAVYVSAAEGLRLRKEPNPNAEILATMPQGTKLTPLDRSGDWIKAEYQGKTGWCLSTYTSTESPLIYKNSDYGFQLTFPESWAGYKIFKKNVDGATVVYYFAVPTNDKNWKETGIDAGYGSLFAISVYTQAQWNTLLGSDEPAKPAKLGEKDGYVISWSSGQATPSDKKPLFSEIKTIIETFKII